jgi:hypothetical protein
MSEDGKERPVLGTERWEKEKREDTNIRHETSTCMHSGIGVWAR